MFFLRNVFHHIPRQVEYLKNIKQFLKSDGKIAIIDYKERGFTFTGIFGHFTPEDVLLDKLKKAGFYCIHQKNLIFYQDSPSLYSVLRLKGSDKLSIKSLVKEHFSHSPHDLISDHLTCLFHNKNEIKVKNSVFDENVVFDEKEIYMRKFSLEDRDRCTEIFKKVFSADPWHDEWKSLQQVRNYLDELIENPVFEGYVACEGLHIVAICLGHRRSWWMGKEFFVDEFYVENERQGNGIGTKLMDFVTKSLVEEGYTHLTLLTNKEIPAEEFYLKNGFYNNLQRTVMVKNI